MPRFIGVIAAAVVGTLATSAAASDLVVDITLPEHQTAAYRRPYVVVWIERPSTPVGTLAIWFDARAGGGHGSWWLRNLRTWWRSGARSLAQPVDSVSGPTRGPGHHTVRFSDNRGVLHDLADGDYVLAVEAAREHGRHEVVRTPFHWRRVGPTPQVRRNAGVDEIGAVVVTVA